MFEKYEKFGAEKLSVKKSELNALSIILICLVIASFYKYYSDRSLSFENKKALLATLDSIANLPNDREIFKEFDVSKNKIKYHERKNEKFLIDINSASHLELMKLPSIGEKTAKLILEYRNRNGKLKNEDLLDIKGIGDKTYEKIRPYLIESNNRKIGLVQSIENDNIVESDTIINEDIRYSQLENDKIKLIDINTANLKEIMQLDGIGKVIAERIIEYRKSQKFEKIEDLIKVQGISKKKFEKVKKQIEIK